MPTEPLFLLALGVAVLGVLVALAGLWWYSGEPERHYGPWERPAAAAPQSPLPPGYQLVIDAAGTGWTDPVAWKQLVDRLRAVAVRLDAGPAPIPAPFAPERIWFDAELERLEASAGFPARREETPAHTARPEPAPAPPTATGAHRPPPNHAEPAPAQPLSEGPTP